MRVERYLSQDDAAVLSRLAEHLLRTGDMHLHAGERLAELIARSILVPESDCPPKFVALDTTVTYREVGSTVLRSLDIVCPRGANPGLAQVSILTPLALALIGRPLGSIAELPYATGAQYLHVVAAERLSMPAAARRQRATLGPAVTRRAAAVAHDGDCDDED